MINQLPVKKWSFIIIFIILIGMFIIRPSIVGFGAYQQIKSSNYSMEDYGKSIQELKSELLISDTNLSSCDEFNKRLFEGVEKFSDRSYECKSTLSALETKFYFSENRYEEIIAKLEADLDEKNEELNELVYETGREIDGLKSEQDILVQNIANNICCKAKVDNSDISYYEIEDNKIVCAEEGTLSISCFSDTDVFLSLR